MNCCARRFLKVASRTPSLCTQRDVHVKARGNTPPEIYGWRSIPVSDKNKVRAETLLVLRAAETAERTDSLCRPWLLENNVSTEPNIFMLPEVRKLLSLSGVSVSRFSHCTDSAHRNPVSRLLGNVRLDRIDDGILAQDKNYFSQP